MIPIMSSFEFLSPNFLDNRQSFNTLEEMYNFNTNNIPEGFICYCKETGENYIFKIPIDTGDIKNYWTSFNLFDYNTNNKTIMDSIGLSRKNLFKVTLNSDTIDHVTVTVNSDKSVSIKGTATKSNNIKLGYAIIPEDNEYVVSGGTQTIGIKLMLNDSGNLNTISNVYNTDVIFSATKNQLYEIYVKTYLGSTYDHTFYPMIRYSNITDNTYEPYPDSLQTQIKELQNGKVSCYIDPEDSENIIFSNL